MTKYKISYKLAKEKYLSLNPARSQFKYANTTRISNVRSIGVQTEASDVTAPASSQLPADPPMIPDSIRASPIPPSSLPLASPLETYTPPLPESVSASKAPLLPSRPAPTHFPAAPTPTVVDGDPPVALSPPTTPTEVLSQSSLPLTPGSPIPPRSLLPRLSLSASTSSSPRTSSRKALSDVERNCNNESAVKRNNRSRSLTKGKRGTKN